MLQICALASGSNGNCYYVGNRQDAILIDAGISRRQILERMKKKGLDPLKIKAVFVSHEHSDHSCGVKVLSKKLSVPVYMTSATFNNSRPNNRPDSYKPFLPGDVVQIGDLAVHSFTKWHDAAEPCSFVVEGHGIRVGVMTDIGEACDNVKRYVSLCDALFLESNYDEKMLWEGQYPPHLKARVAGKYGHLSNVQAAQLVADHATDCLKHICLSHLSAENNLPNLAMDSFNHLFQKHNVVLSNRYAPGDVIEIGGV